MVIESIDNIEVAYELAKQKNIEMPILNATYDILYNNLDAKKRSRNAYAKRTKGRILSLA